MRFLLPLLLLLPLVEIAGFVIVGREVGVLNTLALIVLTGIAGVLLLRRQGVDTLRRAQARLDRGEPPVREALDGIFVALGGLLLIIPGFVTDALGILLLLPPVRAWLRGRMSAGIRVVHGPGAGTDAAGAEERWRDAGRPRYRRPEIIEGEYQEVRPPAPGPEELPPPDSRWRPPGRD